MNKRKKIMIADDDPAILDALKIFLEIEMGYRVETTVNGNTVKDVQDEYPDLVLLDIWMSGMNGTDICEYLKKNFKTAHIPIIMVSANKDTEKLALECGADGFITKPFDLDELLTKVESYIGTPEVKA